MEGEKKPEKKIKNREVKRTQENTKINEERFQKTGINYIATQ